jgi:hypothetical protein
MFVLSLASAHEAASALAAQKTHCEHMINSVQYSGTQEEHLTLWQSKLSATIKAQFEIANITKQIVLAKVD